MWLATFDIFTVAQRDPDVRAAVADGLEDARMLWARLLYGVDAGDEQRARAIGSLHQALVSGVLVQWLIDPERAPSRPTSPPRCASSPVNSPPTPPDRSPRKTGEPPASSRRSAGRRRPQPRAPAE